MSILSGYLHTRDIWEHTLILESACLDESIHYLDVSPATCTFKACETIIVNGTHINAFVKEQTHGGEVASDDGIVKGVF